MILPFTISVTYYVENIFFILLSMPEKHKFSHFGHLNGTKPIQAALPVCGFDYFWTQKTQNPANTKESLNKVLISRCNLWFWSSQTYSVFHGFGQTKFAYGGLILGSNQFSHLPHNASKREFALKAVISDSKIFAPCCKSKSLKHTVSALWPEC